MKNQASDPKFPMAYRIWILTGVLFLTAGSLKAQTVIDTFDLPSGYTTAELKFKNALQVDPSNNVWVCFRNIGAGKFDGVNWVVYDSLQGLPSNNVTCVAFSNATTWFGTNRGIAKLNSGVYTIYDSLNSGLTTNHINTLFVDSNNLWAGTNDGAFLFDGTTWIHYDVFNSAIASDTVSCFAKTGNDTIWIGTGNGLEKFHNGNFTRYDIYRYSNTSNNWITRIIPDTAGIIWLQSYFSGSNSIHLLINDSISSLHNFLSICFNPTIFGKLIAVENGKVILGSYSSSFIYEIKIDPFEVNYVTFNFNLGNPPTYVAAGPMQHLWVTRSSSSITKLFSFDYSNSLQSVIPENCFLLDDNQVQAKLFNNGTLFFNEGGKSYEVPKGSGMTSIFLNGLWIGGLDNDNKLHLAAQTYRQSGNDFWPGALDTTNASIDSATIARFDSIWKIDRYQVNEFLTQYTAGNVTNGTYTIPAAIMNWPGIGIPGQTARFLAPFVDNNGDGNYDPYDGDYPAMKGDQMLWWVMNDNYAPHTETGSLPLGIELQCSAYSYGCQLLSDSDEAINFTTFHHYDIINRSDTDYSQLYIGIFTDIDLGNYLDDYVGCDTILNIAYGYNGDNFDDGITGYGAIPPIQNLLFLNDTMTHFMYHDNNGSALGNPNSPQDYYNYLHSLWRDSTNLTYGGNGHGGGLGGTSTPANFMFCSNPYDTLSTAWNETTAGNSSDDRRFIASTGPFDFPAHSIKTLDFAYVWTRDSIHPNGPTTSWAKNVHDVMKVKNWYANNNYPCNNIGTSLYESSSVENDFTIYPNPGTGEFFVSVNSKSSETFKLDVLDISGRIIRHIDLKKAGSSKIALTAPTNGIYFIKIYNDKFSLVKKYVKL